jgi:hypothetical protein
VLIEVYGRKGNMSKWLSDLKGTAHFVSNGGDHNEPKFGIHQAGPTIASKPPKRSVPPMAPLNPQREALAQREVGPELIALLVTWIPSMMRGESLRACACIRALFVARRRLRSPLT